MKATSYDDINVLLETLLTQMRIILGEKLLGLYLYGSATAGDFNQAVSDIDLLAVIEKDLTEQEFIGLEVMHKKFTLTFPEWEHRIEVAYLSVKGLQNFKVQKSRIVVISPGEPLNTKDAGIDWLINWYYVQEYGIMIFGPPKNTFIPKISQEEYISAVKDSTNSWKEEIKSYNKKSAPGSLAYVIFTMCRLIYGYKKGKQVSKKEAGLWVSTEFPEWRSLIEDATTWRNEQWNEKQKNTESAFPIVVEFVNFAIDQILDKS